MPFDPASLGFPVELGNISRQLKKLWETEGDTKTRASLINFAVFAQGDDSLVANTELISQFVRDHSCRAVLVGHVPSAPEKKVSAWIQAHCHLTKAGAKQVCSEQVTLLAEGFSDEGVSNILMSNLDYDLPLNLWWQPEFPETAHSPLWTWVDRLIYDSATWKNPAEQLHRLHLLKAQGGTRMALSDLNWTRSLGFRQALAQCFDQPAILADLASINRVEIRHRAGFESTASLLGCWLGAQLGWTVADHYKQTIQFRCRENTPFECQLVSSNSGPVLAGITITSDTFQLSLDRESGGALLHSKLKADKQTIEGHFSAGAETTKGLLSEEMNPSIRHKVYLKALALLQTVF